MSSFNDLEDEPIPSTVVGVGLGDAVSVSVGVNGANVSVGGLGVSVKLCMAGVGVVSGSFLKREFKPNPPKMKNSKAIPTSPKLRNRFT